MFLCLLNCNQYDVQTVNVEFHHFFIFIFIFIFISLQITFLIYGFICVRVGVCVGLICCKFSSWKFSVLCFIDVVLGCVWLLSTGFDVQCNSVGFLKVEFFSVMFLFMGLRSKSIGM